MRQVVVLMVATTAPEDIAGYANRVANTWKLAAARWAIRCLGGHCQRRPEQCESKRRRRAGS